MDGYSPWKTNGTYLDSVNSSDKGNTLLGEEKRTVEEQPLSTGVGKYHFNRTVAYFPVPSEYYSGLTPGIPLKMVHLPNTVDRPSRSVLVPDRSKLSNDAFRKAVASGNFSGLVADFYGIFERCFNHSNVAKVAVHNVPNATYESTSDLAEFRSTREVNLGGEGHEDWVALRSNKSNFYGTTQKRMFAWPSEQALVALLFLAGHGSLGLTTAQLLELNKKHFLAGRRSWTIGYDKKRKLCFVETIAIERFSDTFYEQMSGELGLYEDVPLIWSNLFLGYLNHALVGQSAFTSPAELPEQTSVNRNVYYYQRSFESMDELKSDAVYSATAGRHRSVVDGGSG